MKHLPLTSEEHHELTIALMEYMNSIEEKLDEEFLNARLLAIENGDFDGAVDDITDTKMHMRVINSVIQKLNKIEK